MNDSTALPPEVNMATAIELTGRTRNEILSAYHAGKIRGRVKRTRRGVTYGYYFSRESLLAWVERDWGLDAQARAIDGLGVAS